MPAKAGEDAEVPPMRTGSPPQKTRKLVKVGVRSRPKGRVEDVPVTEGGDVGEGAAVAR